MQAGNRSIPGAAETPKPARGLSRHGPHISFVENQVHPHVVGLRLDIRQLAARIRHPDADRSRIHGAERAVVIAAAVAEPLPGGVVTDEWNHQMLRYEPVSLVRH